MKIGIDIRHLAGGNLSGVGYYTVNLIKEMSKLAPKDEFILFASGTLPSLNKIPDFNELNVHIVKKDLPNKVVSAYMKSPYGPTLEDLLGEKIDCWFFPNINMIRTKLPYVITMHDASFKIMPEFFTLKTRIWHKVAGIKKLLSEARHILSVSESTKLDVEEIWQIDPSKVTATHLGVALVYNKDPKPSDKNFLNNYKIDFPYFLTLSTLEPRKNIESVIEAYDAARITNQKSPNSITKFPHLVIAGGDGWKTKDIKRLAAISPFADDIHLIGYVDNKHKPALYRNAEVFLFPSFYEGFGLPALEAMASGTPVITSFTGSMPEVVEDAAIMIDPYNVSDLVQSLKILSDPSILSDLTTRGIIQAQKFTWKRTAQKTLDVLHNLV